MVGARNRFKDIAILVLTGRVNSEFTTLVRALGFSGDDEIFDILVITDLVRNTIEKDIHKSPMDSRTRWSSERNLWASPSGEPKTAESSRSLLVASFDPHRYDLAAVGRYKINRSSTSRLTFAEPNNCWASCGCWEQVRSLLKQELLYFIIVIDSIEQLDNGLNKITYIPNDSAVLTEPVELQSSKLWRKWPRPCCDHCWERESIWQGSDCNPCWHFGWDELLLNLAEGIGRVDDIDHLGNRRSAVGELWLAKFVWDFLENGA